MIYLQFVSFLGIFEVRFQKSVFCFMDKTETLVTNLCSSKWIAILGIRLISRFDHVDKHLCHWYNGFNFPVFFLINLYVRNIHDIFRIMVLSLVSFHNTKEFCTTFLPARKLDFLFQKITLLKLRNSSKVTFRYCHVFFTVCKINDCLLHVTWNKTKYKHYINKWIIWYYTISILLIDKEIRSILIDNPLC